VQLAKEINNIKGGFVENDFLKNVKF